MSDKYASFFLPGLLFSVILILWEIASGLEWINSALFSSPLDIFKAIQGNTTLLLHLRASVFRLGVSVIIGYPLGVFCALLSSSLKGERLMEGFASFFMAIPGISWAPVGIILLGFGNITILTVGALTAFFPGFYHTIQGNAGIDTNLINLSHMLQYSGVYQFLFVRIPAMSTFLIMGLKESFSRAWRTIIAIEMIAATQYGIGYMTYDARELLQSNTMFLGILVSGITCLLIEKIFIAYLEKKTIAEWGMKNTYG
ncbi:MAG: ABC transporter permease [Fibrobacterota bacterium]